MNYFGVSNNSLPARLAFRRGRRAGIDSISHIHTAIFRGLGGRAYIYRKDIALHADTTRRHVQYRQRMASGALRKNEIETGLCLQPIKAAMRIPGLDCGWAAMHVSLPGHGKCVCIVYKPSFEMMRQALDRANKRSELTAAEYETAVGHPATVEKCKVQIAIDGATHRGREKKTVIFGGWIGRLLDRDRRRICCNYNGLFKVICEGESLDASALAFQIAQRACVEILGDELTEFADNVLKDDGRGLEAGLLWSMESSGSQDFSEWGGIISELHHRRRNLRKKFAPVIGKGYVDIISAGMHRTSSSSISDVEFHVY